MHNKNDQNKKKEKISVCISIIRIFFIFICFQYPKLSKEINPNYLI